jgi:membrane-bound lytic murein transglycosylase MltF
VGGPASPKLNSIRDLADQKVFVRQNSSQEAALKRLNETFTKEGLKPVHIEYTGPYLEAEDNLEMVSSGLIPFTVVGEDLATLWKKYIY